MRDFGSSQGLLLKCCVRCFTNEAKICDYFPGAGVPVQKAIHVYTECATISIFMKDSLSKIVECFDEE